MNYGGRQFWKPLWCKLVHPPRLVCLGFNFKWSVGMSILPNSPVKVINTLPSHLSENINYFNHILQLYEGSDKGVWRVDSLSN